MKKALIFLGFCAGISAQQSTITATLEPAGLWTICESQQRALYSEACAGFVEGHETYQLAITTTDPSTTGFLWTAGGQLTKTGRWVTLAGIVDRAPGTGPTYVTVDFGGITNPSRKAQVIGQVIGGGSAVTDAN